MSLLAGRFGTHDGQLTGPQAPAVSADDDQRGITGIKEAANLENLYSAGPELNGVTEITEFKTSEFRILKFGKCHVMSCHIILC